MIKRIMKYSLSILLIIIALILAASASIIYTEAGTRWFIKVIKPTGIAIKKVEGKLAGPVVFSHINVENNNQQFYIDHTYLEWRPLALLRGKLHINKLLIENISVVIKDHITTSTSNHPSLPLRWFIEFADIESITIDNPKEQWNISLGGAQLRGRSKHGQIKVTTHWHDLDISSHDRLLIHNRSSDFRILGSSKHYFIHGKSIFKTVYLNTVLENRPNIQANINLSVKDKLISIETLNLKADHTLVNIQGQIDDHYALTWSLHSAKLAELLPGSSGSIEAQGSLQGSKEHPLLKMMTTLKGFTYDKYRVGLAKAIVFGDIRPQGKIDVNITVQHVAAEQALINQFVLTANGTAEQHTIRSTLDARKGNAHLTASGSFDFKQKRWLSSINQLSINTVDLGQWSLPKPATFSYSHDDMIIKDLHIQQNEQYLLLAGHWHSKKDSQLHLHVNQIQLNKLSKLFIDKGELHSILNADIELHKTAKQGLYGRANIGLTQGYLEYTLQDMPHHFDIQQASWLANLDKMGLNTHLKLNTADQQYITADINLPDFPQPSYQQTLDGHIKIDIHELSVLQPFIPTINNPSGKINLSFKLKGTLDKVITQGDARLIDANLEIPDLGIDLHQTNIRVSGDAKGKMHIQGQTYSQKGYLKVNGTASFTDQILTSRLNITGKDFLIANLPEYKLSISPELELHSQDNKIYLKGIIFIPEAKFTPQRYSQESITLPNDIEYVGLNDQPIDQTPLQLYSDIKLLLGDKVSIDYSGLTGYLTGKLNIKDAPESTTTAIGNLFLSGSYKIYGQTLSINQGRLAFTGGDVANPSLDIQASKNIALVSASNNGSINNLTNAAALVTQGNQITVGVNVQGTVKNRQITLFSQPSILNQPDILSYLILGRPAAQASQADAQLLYNAATALDLGGNQVNNLSQQVKQTFGLDEINIGAMTSSAPQTNTTLTDNTSLILGKALTPKLYLNYSIGLIQPINTLRLRYFFTPNWIIQSETSSLANAADLFYTFDR